MVTRPFARLGSLQLTLFALVVLAGAGLLSFGARQAESGLVVHEWGTFTSVAGQDGITLDWRPLTVESDLPSFVYSVDSAYGRSQQPESPRPDQPAPPQVSPPQSAQPRPSQPLQPQSTQPRELRYPSKSAMPGSVRMETPVLYFYAKEELSVSVKVDFVGGRITEWYPQGRSVRGGRIDWGTFSVLPNAHVDLPNDFRENHYYPARETEAAPLKVGNSNVVEFEKFLFYRGVGNFDLPLSVKLEGKRVRIRNEYRESICKIVLFENIDGKLGYRIQDMPQTELSLDRPVLDGKVEVLREEIKAMLVSQGLFEKEADAMLATWRDSWFEEGLRVFYVMPRKATDTILPMVIAPQPIELVRVLVGRTEIITPEMEQNVMTQITRLDSPSARTREAALKAINKYGRFRATILTQILKHTRDPRIRTRAERLLGA